MAKPECPSVAASRYFDSQEPTYPSEGTEVLYRADGSRAVVVDTFDPYDDRDQEDVLWVVEHPIHGITHDVLIKFVDTGEEMAVELVDIEPAEPEWVSEEEMCEEFGLDYD